MYNLYIKTNLNKNKDIKNNTTKIFVSLTTQSFKMYTAQFIKNYLVY